MWQRQSKVYLLIEGSRRKFSIQVVVLEQLLKEKRCVLTTNSFVGFSAALFFVCFNTKILCYYFYCCFYRIPERLKLSSQLACFGE